MKTITIDLDTYQNELNQAKLSGQTEAIQKFKAELVSHTRVKNIQVEESLLHGIPPHHLVGAKKPTYDWFQNNFTDEELNILFNK